MHNLLVMKLVAVQIMIAHQLKHVWIETALKYVTKYSVDEMQFVNQITVIMRAVIVWMAIVVIRWLLVNDPNAQQIMIAHSIWHVLTNVVKIHVTARLGLSAASIIMLLHANVYLDMLVMHTRDVHLSRLNQHLNVPLMLIVRQNWLASIMFAKIHA